MAKTSAKMTEVKSCVCRNYMPYRMQAENHKSKHGMTFTLGCMMCGRNADGDSPRQCVDNWNAQHAEKEVA